MQRYPIVIFSRIDSRRFPGKALAEIAGRPLLGWTIRRCQTARQAGAVVVATSERPIDDPIVALAAGAAAGVFRGPAHDVAGRALAAAARLGATAFVRISGDSPFIDPALIDEMIAIHRTGTAKLTTNLAPRSFPPGQSVEIIDTACMRDMLADVDDAEDREHVTAALYRLLAPADIRNVTCPISFPAGLALTVDVPADLARMNQIATRLGADALHAGLAQLVAAATADNAAWATLP